MHDVFNIVVPSEEDGICLKMEVYNLYTDYMHPLHQKWLPTATATWWYNSWPEGPLWRKYLIWMHRLFENNTSSELAEKVNEMYMVFAELKSN